MSRKNRTPIRARAALALAGAAAVTVVGLGGTGLVALAAPSKASGTIRSGAGPGWPRTLQPSDFVAQVDNPWFPLIPGSKWRYRGVDGDGRFADRMRVMHRTKRILGVRTTVVHDLVLRHGKPREVTNDWYAQDHHGNVWYFGENTKELDRHGNVITREGSWKAGRDGARPGVLFPGHPRVGLTARQEFYKGHAEDHFKVLDRNASASVPFVSSHHAVKTKEWTPLEPGVAEHKYYVRGVGDVKEVTFRGPKERLRLVSFHAG